jgi:PrtD family type I secretion system ABC transporter
MKSAGAEAVSMPNSTQGDVNAALRACRGAFVVTGVFSFFINLLMLTAPLYMLQVYDRVLSSRSESTLVALTVLAGTMLLVMGLLDLVRSRILVRIGSRLDRQLNARVFGAVFERSVRGFRGERVQALRDLDSLRQFLTGPAPFALFDAPWVPVYLGVVFLFHPILGFVALMGAVILLFLGALNELLTRRVLQEANSQVVGAYAFAEAGLRHAEALKAMGMMAGIQRRWIDRHAQGLALQAQASDRAGAVLACSKATRMLVQVTILGAGAMLAIRQVITPGVMIAASILMGRALAPVEQAIGSWRQFVGARVAYRRLQGLLAETTPPAARLRLPRPEGYLSVENIIAVPPGATKPVLKGMSFELRAGDALGVIGPSAAGKSTLARLLVGIWPPYAGAVRLEGAELRNWHPEDLGIYIGYLPQDVDLLAGTVAENISRFYADPEPDEIVGAAQLAGAHELILRLPNGYDTQIGENGSFLSGGQRQRIALARAVYGNPSLVVLDEPNSNLDAAGDQALTEAILKLKRRMTTVVVMAHRPSAITAVDKLLMLRDGKAEAFGAKDEILSRLTRQAAGVPGSNITAVGSRS